MSRLYTGFFWPKPHSPFVDAAQLGLGKCWSHFSPCPLSAGAWCYDSQDPMCGEDTVSVGAVWDWPILEPPEGCKHGQEADCTLQAPMFLCPSDFLGTRQHGCDCPESVSGAAGVLLLSGSVGLLMLAWVEFSTWVSTCSPCRAACPRLGG